MTTSNRVALCPSESGLILTISHRWSVLSHSGYILAGRQPAISANFRLFSWFSGGSGAGGDNRSLGDPRICARFCASPTATWCPSAPLGRGMNEMPRSPWRKGESWRRLNPLGAFEAAAPRHRVFNQRRQLLSTCTQSDDAPYLAAQRSRHDSRIRRQSRTRG